MDLDKHVGLQYPLYVGCQHVVLGSCLWKGSCVCIECSAMENDKSCTLSCALRVYFTTTIV